MRDPDAKPQSIDSQIHARIRRGGLGSVFVPTEFLDLGSREAIDVSLHRLARKGVIRRLARGVYDFPKTHPVLGPLQPSAETIAKALARVEVQPGWPSDLVPYMQEQSEILLKENKIKAVPDWSKALRTEFLKQASA